ncbi:MULTISPECIES: hypothetical protein [Thermoflexus]|jgi:hypothetical protein|uniref:Uncharacterized protein n=1 Tax=Thermoflexus hugenholtzii JAD2 TaxID=877466 RepID=A0A212QRZ0_9CHLR|nr:MULTISPECIES: hypothetical protein [Thermoflexus]QWK10926.1 MAG: hypothetical protein KNN16_01320 [Thermoflexus hugenholtzii]SNB62345.1 hypothetical protein SAMN02746019_00004970 [Thermoflexus hugenholtzii JAD2]
MNFAEGGGMLAKRIAVIVGGLIIGIALDLCVLALYAIPPAKYGWIYHLGTALPLALAAMIVLDAVLKTEMLP